MRVLISKARRWVFDAKDGVGGASEGFGPVLVRAGMYGEPDAVVSCAMARRMLCHSAARAAAPGPVAAHNWRIEWTTGRAPEGAPAAHTSSRTRARWAGKVLVFARRSPTAASRVEGGSRLCWTKWRTVGTAAPAGHSRDRGWAGTPHRCSSSRPWWGGEKRKRWVYVHRCREDNSTVFLDIYAQPLGACVRLII